MASDTRCSHYHKRSGTGAIAGQLYEVKICCLMFLRGIRYGRFRLATNFEGAGAFDDVILQLHGDHGPTNTTLMQLKHRENADVFRTKLLSHSQKHKFALIKFFISYRDKILPQFQNRSDENAFGCSLDDLSLVLYTNAGIIGLPEVSDHEDDLLSTGTDGGVFTFKQERDKDVWGLAQDVEDLGDISQYGSFLQKLKVYTRQAAEPELDALLKKELCDTLVVDPEHSECVLSKLLGKVQEWWGATQGVYLTESSSLWSETITEASRMINKPISRQIAMLGIGFEDDAVASLSVKLTDARVLLCQVHSETTRLSLCKVVQALEQGCRTFVLGHSHAALRFWQSPWCPLLAMECTDPSAELLSTLQSVLGRHPDKALVVVVRGKDSRTATVVRDLVSSGLVEVVDENNLASLDRASAQRVLTTAVEFQGYSVHLGGLISEHDTDGQLKTDMGKISIWLNSFKDNFIFTAQTIKLIVDLMDRLAENEHMLQHERNTRNIINPATLLDMLECIGQLKDMLYYVIHAFQFVLGRATLIEKLRDVSKRLTNVYENCELEKRKNVDSVLNLMGEVEKRRDPFRKRRNVTDFNTLLESVDVEKELDLALGPVLHSPLPVELQCAIATLRKELNDDITTMENVCNQDKHTDVRDVFTHQEDVSLQLELQYDEEELKTCYDLIMELKDEAARLDVILEEQKVKGAFTQDLLYSLVKGEPIRLGAPLEKHLSYYIPRTLQREGTVRPDSVWDLPERVTVIVAEPGMGKSTLMTHVALQTKAQQPTTWVFKVNLNSMTSYLLHIKADSLTENHVVQFLATATGGMTEFERILLEYSLHITRNVVVVLDGFDEVCPHYQSPMIRVLQEIQSTNIQKIWISSRDHLADELKTQTKSRAFSIDRFTEDNQRYFLRKVWSERVVGVDATYLEAYIDDVLRVMSESLSGSEKSFLGIPLQTMLVVEALEGDLRGGHQDGRQTLRQLDITDLYEQFFRKKCNVYLEEKQGMDLSKPYMLSDYEQKLSTIEAIHETAALMLYLTEEEHTVLLDGQGIEKQKDNFMREYHDKWIVIGIVTGMAERKPQFVHRTVAEYLVAKWLTKYRDKNRAIIKKNLYRSDYTVVKMFFDRIMTSGLKLHSSVLGGDAMLVGKCLQTLPVKTTDRGGRTALHIAATDSNSSKVLQVLLQHGADVNVRDKVLQLSPIQYADHCSNWRALDVMLDYTTDLPKLSATRRNKVAVLYVACKGGHLQLLRYLLRVGLHLNVQLNKKGMRPLHVACQHGRVRLVEYLINVPRRDMNVLNIFLNRMKLNAQDADGCSAMHYAVIQGNVSIMSLLIGARCNIDLFDKKKRSPLFCAVESGRLDAIRLLIQAGCNVDACNKTNSAPLHCAVQKGQLDVVRFLIDARCNVDACDWFNITPLHLASQKGHIEIVRCLIQAGCNVDARDANGITPFHCATQNGDVATVRLLIAAKCNVHACDANRISSLHRAAQNGYLDIAKLLVAAQCNVNVYDTLNISPLYRAAQNGHVDVVRLLIEARCDLNSRGNNDITPLHRAVQNDHLDVARLLIEARCDVDVHDKDGLTPLHRAAQTGRLDAARLLVDARCHVDARNRFESTPLHYASSNGHIDVVQFLVEQGCDVNAQDHFKRTAYELSIRYQHHQIMRYLRRVTATVHAVLNGDGTQ